MEYWVTKVLHFISFWLTAICALGGLLFFFQWLLLEVIIGSIIKACGTWKLMIEFVYHLKEFKQWKKNNPQKEWFKK